jgi:phage shock protein A
MNLLTVVVLVVVALLVIMGVKNRKKLAFWVKAETNDFIENNIDGVKVAKQQIKDADEMRKKIVDEAGTLLAEEKAQLKSLDELKVSLEKTTKEATNAKKNDNKDLAIVKLKQKKQIQTQIDAIEENIQVLSKTRSTLELQNEKLRGKIANYKIQLSGLKARKTTNEALSGINFGSINGETLEETLNSEEVKITKEEVKLQYKMEVENIEDEEVTTEELEKEFNNL